ncbi:cupin domain-containing protein [Massilia sp. BJB1822]|uniref:cupin domain-containing protein n=1 Tax=Massilia sp. BJB1822 TaxID=2744470 RepID=UPI001594B6C3|nr:cupin domain-containing protein [Massilia sp. BJB1822]NVE00063.1 cupin domain-containing protein [Massilia sp. BJB1822]
MSADLEPRGDMRPHDLLGALAGTTAGRVDSAEADAAAFPRLAAFNCGAVYVGRLLGGSPWECHPDADELLQVLEGEVEVTLLAGLGPLQSVVQTVVRAGSILVVPRGVWHRQWSELGVTLMAVTPDRSAISFENDPRTDPRICITAKEGQGQ